MIRGWKYDIECALSAPDVSPQVLDSNIFLFERHSFSGVCNRVPRIIDLQCSTYVDDSFTISLHRLCNVQ